MRLSCVNSVNFQHGLFIAGIWTSKKNAKKIYVPQHLHSAPICSYNTKHGLGQAWEVDCLVGGWVLLENGICAFCHSVAALARLYLSLAGLRLVRFANLY